jgi:hypothetical protein
MSRRNKKELHFTNIEVISKVSLGSASSAEKIEEIAQLGIIPASGNNIDNQYSQEAALCQI